MFKEIYVKNFVLIDELHLDFSEGLSAFTGETGAGKSLLIDAISLLCGGRASSEYVARNCEYALIEGIFSLGEDHPVSKICEEMGIEMEDELIVTRKITSEGKSSVKINQRAIPLSALRSVMSLLIDIHSQHDTQYLLNKQSHIALLDEYCHIDDQLMDCHHKYNAYQKAKKEYEEFLKSDMNDDLDFLKYQAEEIEKAQLSEEKITEMNEELKQLNNFEKLHEHLTSSYELLTGSQKTLESLYEAIHTLDALKEFTWVEKLCDLLNNCYYEIEETASDINEHLQNLDYDENRLNEINEYLFAFNNLKRKHGNSVKAILEKKETLIRRIAMIENRQSVLDELSVKVQMAYRSFEEAALEISAIRKEKALTLEKEIAAECNDLYLAKTRFEVRFTPCEANSKGLDKVEFYVSMNPGEPLKPLCNVASGGELSRLMLALKTIFTDLTSIETLIFDEIDTGVSGKVALAIGQKMRQIAQKHQLFAITHLSSVAACAHHHYTVEKIQHDDTTKTNVHRLDYDEIIRSLALLSTNSLSDHALMAAKELYEIAQAN